MVEQKTIEIDRNLNYLGQALNTYLIFDDGVDVYFIDQHAAHERLNYEMLRENSKKGVSSQILLVPKIIKLAPSDYRLCLSNDDIFKSLGFDIEDFNDNSIVVRSVPTNVKENHVERLIYEILSEISKSGNIKSEDFNQMLVALKDYGI